MVLLAVAIAGNPTQAAASAAAHVQGPAPTIVAFGDSLTAGLGVPTDRAYPAQLAQRLEKEGFPHRVVNAGVSGDTTAGGLRRVGWVLQNHPQIVILSLGANDGLRGLKIDDTRRNLEGIIEQLQAAKVQVILAGMKLPPNYGAEYIASFEAMFPALADKYHVPLIPFLLAGVAADPSFNQADGIHPTEDGYRIVTETVYRTLAPLVAKAGSPTAPTTSKPTKK
ncbi:MAG: arylesterase [Nitrospiraceae bacterium]